jgi:TPR repeat protein
MEAGLQLWTAAGSSSGDKATAVKSFQEAARKGDPKGNLALGECYLLGIGVPRDEKLALERFREAAKTDLQAMNRLGDCLAHGIGGKTDYTEAAALFMKAFQAGNLEALANLGILYLNGQGQPADPQQAAKLFEQGANKGNARCQSLLARCVEGGLGITKDIERAQSLYIQAAAAGDKFAAAWCRKRNIQVDSKQ